MKGNVMRVSKAKIASAILVFALLGFSGCGGGASSSSATTSPSSTTPTSTTENNSGNTQVSTDGAGNSNPSGSQLAVTSSKETSNGEIVKMTAEEKKLFTSDASGSFPPSPPMLK